MAGAGGRVVLFPVPYQGHFKPMLRLAAALHARGLAITVIHTDLNRPDPADHPPGFRFVSLSATVPPEVLASDDVARVVTTLNACFAAPVRDQLAALQAGAARDGGAGGGTVRCVITDAVWFSAQAAARELGLPAVALVTNSAASFRTFLAYPTLIQKGYLPVQESQMNAMVPDLPPFRVRDLERIDMNSLSDFATMIEHVVAGARQASGVILNTSDAMEAANIEKIRQNMLPVPVFCVGPLNKLSPPPPAQRDGDQGCLDWLDTQAPRSVLYVSFGSLAAIDAREFVELAWGLAGSGRPFIWVVRPSLVRGGLEHDGVELPSELEEELRGRGRIVSWAPQEQVLAHPAVGAFFTHNGWNSTVEGISEGVPMLCRPCFGDQLGSARYACAVWRVGVEVEPQLERGNIRAAIEKQMDGEEGEQARARAQDLKEMVEKGVNEGGSSHRDLVNLVDFILSFKCTCKEQMKNGIWVL